MRALGFAFSTAHTRASWPVRTGTGSPPDAGNSSPLESSSSIGSSGSITSESAPCSSSSSASDCGPSSSPRAAACSALRMLSSVNHHLSSSGNIGCPSAVQNAGRGAPVMLASSQASMYSRRALMTTRARGCGSRHSESVRQVRGTDLSVERKRLCWMRLTKRG